MTKVMCNASPIIGLSILGKLNLLWEMFEVFIPEEVYNEVVLKSAAGNFGAEELEKAVGEKRINVLKVLDRQLIDKGYGILHRGELEVIAGALENGIKVVIIDEKTARNLAVILNLKPLGVLGVLKIAKTQDKIESIKPYLDKLIQNKYRITEKLYFETLEEAGEI
jgi:predicted nucleic acid-binding protein